jgi:uncharacterized membrane protein (UPF0127 family)
VPFVIRTFLIVVLASAFLLAIDAGSGEKRAKNLSITEIAVDPADPSRAARTFRIVLLCDTIESRTRGLQGFHALGRDEAALFVFDRPQAPTFWMGSVTFSIDIIFIKSDGRAAAVYSECKPGSREFYRSGQAVKWVVETAAGSGVKAGDRIIIR